MKRFSLFLVVLTSLFLTGSLNAQLDATFNITSISSRNPQIGGEFAIADNFGIGLDIGIPVGRYDIVINDTETTFKRTGVLASFHAKYYFNPDQATTGFYLAGYSRFRNITFADREVNGTSDPIDDLKNNRLTFGLALGAKYLISDKFVIDAMAGGGFAAVKDNDLLDVFEDLGFFESLESIDLYVRVGIGYRILD